MKSDAILQLMEQNTQRILPDLPMILVGMGTCGIGNDADLIFESLWERIAQHDLPIVLKQTGCFGFCAQEPLVMLYRPAQSMLVYSQMTPGDANDLLDAVVVGTQYSPHLLFRIDDWDFHTYKVHFGHTHPEIPLWNEIPFFKGQQKIVLRHAGLIDPNEILDYIAVGGYQALSKCLTQLSPCEVVAQIKASGLRGRGGAGFPTATKWEIMRQKVSDQKYIICNADEGDPGAYMNRNEIESDPHMLIEGMVIGAYAMGASMGIAYVRAEYPLAVKRLKEAISQATELGLLGSNILESGFSFQLEVVEGAGAFVCGEETALIASIEGKAGRPMPRPPYPAGKGLYGKPTNINNVETWCNVPVIIHNGARWFRQTGTEKSPGTKVFSLVGKVKNTGLVELPLGSPIEQFVFEIGEGTGTHKHVKAVQTGGPSGGCIPVEHFHTAVDYESLSELGAIMGSGGMVVMDQDNCMVDVARYFLEFNSNESCGKCTPCREGLSQALAILNRITCGKGTLADLNLLDMLAQTIKDTAICGLGQTAPNPILTTLRYFREEYETHILEKRCYSGVCDSLFEALCENSCPLHMHIPGYIQLIKEDRLEEAFELTLRDNPIPGTIGRICHFHCQMRCRREMLDEPVSQGEIHRYLADTIYKLGKENNIYNKLVKEKLAPTGKKIAIIGAGPSGLTAAFYLIRLGHQVTVYDAFPEAGGVVRYGIPQYRLPKAVLHKEMQLFHKLGVKFEFNQTLGETLSLESLKTNFDCTYLAIGAWKNRSLHISGADSVGVYSGTSLLSTLAQGELPELGEKVLIIGAGNVAIDAARSIWRLGKEVTVIYRREKEDVPANPIEIEESETEKINFRFLLSPYAVIPDNQGHVKSLQVELMLPGNIEPSGKRKPVSSARFETIECDSIVVAIGEQVDSSLLARYGFAITTDGRLAVNAFTFETSIDGFYAGGDAVTGPSTAAEAMGIAKRAAEAIDFKLMNERRFAKLYKTYSYCNDLPGEPCIAPMVRPDKLTVNERIGNFHEVASGLTGEQARREVCRCLRCDIKKR